MVNITDETPFSVIKPQNMCTFLSGLERGDSTESEAERRTANAGYTPGYTPGQEDKKKRKF